MTDRDDLLTRAQAAELIGLSIWGVGYYRRMRKLPVVRYRGRIFIPKAAALAFKAQREQVEAVS
jgi:phytoene/squalene synthetase